MKPHKRRRFKSKFPRGHVSAAARVLGVTQAHLWLVLHGKRSSRSLSKRYAELFASRDAA